MRKRKTYYELARSQVSTPEEVVHKFWTIFHSYRSSVASVLDLGAGDGRFAIGGKYRSYLGVEIDDSKETVADLPETAKVVTECAFRHADSGFSACIGNPPYVRHHDLEPEWRDKVADSISNQSGVAVNRKCNLYVYFLFLSLLRTSNNGIVATVVPYEWLSRPSAKPLRDYIQKNGWSVDVYRFEQPIFDKVETTASISVIDKRARTGEWRYFSIDSDGTVCQNSSVTGTKRRLIKYESRGSIWAMRGLSPGTQKIFTLTEGERIHAGLRMNDVYPCVTTLRHLPEGMTVLSKSVFTARFVKAGRKCWLIKSDRPQISQRLELYLSCVPEDVRDTATCNDREPWYAFTLCEPPELLVSSGFVGDSPKSVVNSVAAHHVGSVYGVFGVARGKRRPLQRFLSKKDFATRIVPHSGRLRKLEVKQLNAVLNEFDEESTGD